MEIKDKYYLYRHIRLDKNEPFYIGIGTKHRNSGPLKNIYKRAYDKVWRGKIWKDIVHKTEYEIEILFESDNVIWIQEKEKEFIALYGRMDKRLGVLANMTNGGEGAFGAIRTPEYRRKVSESLKGRKVPKEVLEKRSKTTLGVKKGNKAGYKITAEKLSVSIVQLDLSGKFIKSWNSMSEAGRNGFQVSKISLCCKGERETHKGFKWKKLNNK